MQYEYQSSSSYGHDEISQAEDELRVGRAGDVLKMSGSGLLKAGRPINL